MDLRLLPYSPERDVYRLLGVEPGADRATITDACRRLSRTFHPDRNGSPRATEEMQVVNAVRALLADGRARAEYDHARRAFQDSLRLEPARGAAILAPPRPRPRSAAWETAARATLRAFLAAFSSRPPDRCTGCDEPTAAEHRFCAWCGQPQRPMAAPVGAAAAR